MSVSLSCSSVPLQIELNSERDVDEPPSLTLSFIHGVQVGARSLAKDSVASCFTRINHAENTHGSLSHRSNCNGTQLDVLLKVRCLYSNNHPSVVHT